MSELNYHNSAVTCNFQQCGILTCVDSDEPMQPPFKLRNTKWCSVSSLTLIEYSSAEPRLWSDCAYAQADLSLCWSHIPHCWKSHALAHIINKAYQYKALVKWKLSMTNFCFAKHYFPFPPFKYTEQISNWSSLLIGHPNWLLNLIFAKQVWKI